jgi:branched-subunit amino acid ABC-type transport system permease component
VTVLGGFGNPVGALFGGIALGLLESAVPLTPLPVSATPVIEFGLFVVALIAFPGGVFTSRRGAL